jgi:hypothetical protein
VPIVRQVAHLLATRARMMTRAASPV